MDDDLLIEKPQHRVRISKAFYMSAHEITVGQFRKFVSATGYKTDAEKGGDFSHQLTPQGTLQTIYDPFTTKFDPATAEIPQYRLGSRACAMARPGAGSPEPDLARERRRGRYRRNLPPTRVLSPRRALLQLLRALKTRADPHAQ
jgi:formylglycine-generating enzyme required for sulfatase activity